VCVRVLIFSLQLQVLHMFLIRFTGVRSVHGRRRLGAAPALVIVLLVSTTL